MRRLPWILLLAVACSEEAAKPDPKPPADVAPPKVVTPATGVGVLHGKIDGLERDVADAEKRADDVNGAKPLTADQLEALATRARHYLAALEVSTAQEAREANNAKVRALRLRVARVRQEQSVRSMEIEELRIRIRDVLQGKAEVPEGRTLAGLKDKLGEHEEELRKLFKLEEKVNAELFVFEKRRETKKYAPVEDSLATRAIKRIEELQERINALQKPSRSADEDD